MTVSQVMQSEQYPEYLELVDVLFANWKLHFGSKLKDRQILDLDTATLWAAALAMLKATSQEIDLAFAASITKKWPPTTPADLLELVRGNNTSQYPESYTAYTHAANGNYLHPVCHATAVRVGLWNMRNLNEYVTRKAWNEVYPLVCADHSHDSVKFDQNLAAIERNNQSDVKLDKPKKSLEEQSAITTTFIENIRNSL